MKEMTRGAKVGNLGPIYTIFIKVVSHICFDSKRADWEEIAER